MAFTGNHKCTSFKKEVLQAKHNFNAWGDGGNTFKIALYDNNASFTAATTVYTATNEVTGTNYSAGGGSLTNVAPVSGSGSAWADFDDYTFSTATITARGAMVYNSTNGNRAVMILDFGRNVTKTAADFVVTFPTADATNAIVLIK